MQNKPNSFLSISLCSFVFIRGSLESVQKRLKKYSKMHKNLQKPSKTVSKFVLRGGIFMFISKNKPN